MAKHKPVTESELSALCESAREVSQNAAYMDKRVSASDNEIDDPLAAASALLAASRTLADLAASMLLVHSINDQKRQIAEMRNAKA
jgi:hypothetical protein